MCDNYLSTGNNLIGTLTAWIFHDIKSDMGSRILDQNLSVALRVLLAPLEMILALNEAMMLSHWEQVQ